MKLKKICGVCIITLLAFSSCKQSYVDELTTQYATISVDGKGFIRQVPRNAEIKKRRLRKTCAVMEGTTDISY